jgi:tetratricopeptide (TPR) repeat protein
MKTTTNITLFAPLLAALAIAAVLLSACAGTPAQTDGLSLDEGIAQIARSLEEELPAGTRIAVINLESPSARFSDFVLDELQGYLVNGKKLMVTERSKLELMRNEISFQMSGEVSDESAVSIGKFLGAQTLITGSLTGIGGSYRCRFNALDVETAVRKASPAVTVRRDNAVAELLPAEAVTPPAQVPARPDPALATQYFNAGFAHYEAGRYAEAVADFTRALEVKSDDAASLRYRGCSYYYLKNYDGSIADASRLIQLEPGNEDHYLLRGFVYGSKGDYDKAIADFTQAIRLDPSNAVAYNNRGATYIDKGEYDKAIADCTEAIRLNPNDASAYMNRGTAYVNKGEYDKAIADCTEAIRLNPNYAEAYTSRGNAYKGKGEYDKEIADHTQAIRLNPNFAMAYYNRGNAYAIGKGEPDKAIADYTQAIRLNPNYAKAYNNRGTAYYFKKDYARARADWEKALQLDPNNANAREGFEFLRGMGY